jgi:hypothetical protein
MSATTQKFSGLTDDQVCRVLSQIASQADMMANMCRMEADRAGEHDAAITFHALDTMLCSLGALADMPIGGNVLGGFADWMVGPLFKPAQDITQSEA